MALWQLWTCDPRWPNDKKRGPNSVNVTESSSSRLQASGRRKLWNKTSTFWVENGRTRFDIFREQVQCGSTIFKELKYEMPLSAISVAWMWNMVIHGQIFETTLRTQHEVLTLTKQNQNMSATCIILYELVKFETCPLQPSNCKVKNSCWTRKLGSCAPPERLGSWVSGLNELQYVSICFNYLRSGSFEYVWTGSIQIEFNNLSHLTKHAFNAMHINTFLQETRKHLQTMCMCLSSWH